MNLIIRLAISKALNPEVISLNIGMAAIATVCMHGRIEYGYWFKAHFTT
jgi:hypothetical protein